MVIRVDVPVVAALVTGEFERTVGDDLVHVHVRRSAGAALTHIHGELVGEFAGFDVAAGLSDELSAHRVDQSELLIGVHACALDLRVSGDEFRMPADGRVGNGEVLDGALHVDAPVHVRWNRHFAEGIVFDARRAAEWQRHMGYGCVPRVAELFCRVFADCRCGGFCVGVVPAVGRHRCDAADGGVRDIRGVNGVVAGSCCIHGFTLGFLRYL